MRPVAYSLSREYRMACVEVEQSGFSDWVLASANANTLNSPELKKQSKTVTMSHAVPLWTDEYSNLWDVLRPIRYALQP